MSVELECDAPARGASLRPGRATTAESAVFKFGPSIWQRFFSADGTDSAGDAPPLKSMRYESLEATFGRGRLSQAERAISGARVVKAVHWPPFEDAREVSLSSRTFFRASA